MNHLFNKSNCLLVHKQCKIDPLTLERNKFGQVVQFVNRFDVRKLYPSRHISLLFKS